MREGTRTSSPAQYPRRLRIAAIVLPSLLIAALVGADYFLVERLLQPGWSHLVTLVVGVAGVLAFSTAVFNQLAALQARDRKNTQALRDLADALEEKRKQLQAVNAAGLALTSELDRDEVLQRVTDQALAITNAKYAALGVFNEEGLVESFTTSGITPAERARIGPLPRGLGLLGHLQRERTPIRLRDLHEHPASVGFPKDHPPSWRTPREPLPHGEAGGRGVQRGRRRGARDARGAGGDRDRERAALRA